MKHEATNPRDRNALILESVPAGSILGYLPRAISQHLGKLVKQDQLGSHAVVLELGSTPNAAINLDLEVQPTSGQLASCKFVPDLAILNLVKHSSRPIDFSSPNEADSRLTKHAENAALYLLAPSSPISLYIGKLVLQVWPEEEDCSQQLDELQEALSKAKQAAQEHSSGNLQRSTSGTGEKLRANFEVLLDSILDQDSHLLSSREHSLLTSYKVCIPKLCQANCDLQKGTTSTMHSEDARQSLLCFVICSQADS